MGVVAKGAKCNVDGCDGNGIRSLNIVRVEGAGLRIDSSAKRKAVLCREHYKEWKKESKENRDLERARFSRT